MHISWAHFASKLEYYVRYVKAVTRQRHFAQHISIVNVLSIRIRYSLALRRVANYVYIIPMIHVAMREVYGAVYVSDLLRGVLNSRRRSFCPKP